jgi:3-dehydroquinate synthase
LLGERPTPAGLGANLEEAVARSLEIKAAVVSRDALEAGERMLLNFGHTVGHAIETAVGYGKLSHGKCVAIGMAAITRNSEALGASEPGTAKALSDALERLGLPTEVPEVDARRYAAAAALDKKGSGGTITLALLRRVGAAYLKRFSRQESAGYLSIARPEAGR